MEHDVERVKQATLAWVKGHFDMRKKFEKPANTLENTPETGENRGENSQEAVEQSAQQLQGNRDSVPASLLLREATRMFNCSEGRPIALATFEHPLTRETRDYPYEVVVFGAKDSPQSHGALEEIVLKCFGDLQDRGATFLVWCKLPVFEYSGDGKVKVYTRFAAIDDKGEQIHVAPEFSYTEAHEVKFLAEPEPFDMEKVGRQELDGEIEPGGYDVIEAREDAILHCAFLCYVAVKALNDAHNELMLPWEERKASLIAGVERLLENPVESAEANHEAWRKFQHEAGWKYGAEKNPELKTHPCMVDYSMLPPIQKAKDAIFQALVRAYFGL